MAAGVVAHGVEVKVNGALAAFLVSHPTPWRVVTQGMGILQIVDANGNYIRDWDGLFPLVVELVNALPKETTR